MSRKEAREGRHSAAAAVWRISRIVLTINKLNFFTTHSLTQNEAVVPEPEQVALLAVEREPLADQVAVGVEVLGPDGRVVPLLRHEELGEQVVLLL